MNDRVLLTMVAEMVRRAILTLRAIPDPDARFKATSGWVVVHSTNEAYGYGEASVRYVPTAAEISEMERVMEAMVKLRQTDVRGYHRLWFFSTGTPIWHLAQREEVSTKTIRARLDASLATVMTHLGLAEIAVEAIHERPEQAITSFCAPTVVGMARAFVPRDRVFVADVGFMIGGRRKKYRGHRHP
jgi:hypothetical protein